MEIIYLIGFIYYWLAREWDYQSAFFWPFVIIDKFLEKKDGDAEK